MSEFEQKIAQMMLQTVEQNRLAAELRSQAEEERLKNNAEFAELRRQAEKERIQAEEERRKVRIQEEEERRKERLKNDAELAELRRQAEEAKKQREEAQKQTEKAIRSLARHVDGYIDNESMIQEDEFAEALREEMQIGDIVLTEVMTRQKSGREYDLLAINGEAVVVGEVKHRLNARDVKRFVTKALPDFINHFPEYAGLKVYGMVAGDIINKDADAEAKKSGLFVLRLKNKSLLVSNVEGAKPIG